MLLLYLCLIINPASMVSDCFLREGKNTCGVKCCERHGQSTVMHETSDHKERRRNLCELETETNSYKNDRVWLASRLKIFWCLTNVQRTKITIKIGNKVFYENPRINQKQWDTNKSAMKVERNQLKCNVHKIKIPFFHSIRINCSLFLWKKQLHSLFNCSIAWKEIIPGISEEKFSFKCLREFSSLNYDLMSLKIIEWIYNHQSM